MATATNLQSEVQKLLDGLGRMPSIVGELGNVVARLSAAFSPLQAALSKLSSFGDDDTVLESANNQSQKMLVSATDRNTVAVSRLAVAIDRMNAMAGGIGRMNLPRATPVEGDGGGVPGAAAGGMSTLGKLAAVAAVAAAAIGVMVVGINLAEREFQKLQSLVKLFNPAVIQTFQFALDNLGATIGRAFVPMFQAATGVVREWTAALAPVIQQLTPVIQQLSDGFREIASNLFRTLAGVLRAMIPLVQRWGEQLLLIAQIGEPIRAQMAMFIRGLLLAVRVMYELSGLGTIVRVLTKLMEAWSKVFTVLESAFDIMETVVNSLVDSFMAIFETLIPFKSIMDALGKAVQTVIRNMYVFAIMMAKFLGLDGVVNALLDSIAKKTMKGDTAAQTPQLKTIEQLSKDMALAASTAVGAAGKGGVRNEQEFWKQTLEQMREAERNGVSIKQILIEIRDKLNPFGRGGQQAEAPPGPANPGPGGVGGGMNLLDFGMALINPAWGGRALAKGLGFN